MEVTVMSSDATVFTEVLVPAQPHSSSAVCGALTGCIPSGVGGVGLKSSRTQSLDRAPFIVWRIHEEFPKSLELVELRSEKPVQSSGLRLIFESELCPFASVVLSQVLDGQWVIFDVAVLTVTGVLYSIALKVASSSKNRLAIQHQSNIERDVRRELTALQQVTSLIATPEFFVVGGESGSILCLPVGSKVDPRQDQPFELKDGDSGLVRLLGLGFRGRIASPVRCLAAQFVSGASLLFALHEDRNVKVWDLTQRTRQFSQSFPVPLDLANASPKSIWVEDSLFVRQGLQVALHYGENTSFETQKAAVIVCVLHATEADGVIRLSHLSLRRTFSIGQGNVINCKILQDRLWVLQKTIKGQWDLLTSSLDASLPLQSCCLQESSVAEQLFQGTGQSWDEFLFAIRHVALDSSGLDEDDSIPNMFLRRLLQPGVRQYAALKDVLLMRGRHLTDFEMGSLTLDGLRKEIKASLKSEPSNSRRALKDWISFCGCYVDSWNHNSVPYGLQSDVSIGSVGLIRKSSVSVIRSLTLLEQLISKRAPTDAGEVILPLDWEVIPGDGAVLAGLLRCMEVITGHLGQMALGVFYEALLRPLTHTLDSLVASFLLIMDVGYSRLETGEENFPFGVDEMRAKMQVHHQRQRKFGLRISQSLHSLREAAGTWDSVLDVVSKYILYLVYSTQAAIPDSGSAAVILGSVPTKVLSQAASQISWTHFEAARNLLLLLSYLVRIRGHLGLSPTQVTRIQLNLLPQIQEGLAINLLLHWLTVTFTEVPPSEDCSLQLSSLQIDGARGEKVQPEKLGAGELALAEILASAFLEMFKLQETFQTDSLPNPDLLNNHVWRFVGWLLVGESPDSYPLTFSGRAITLSSILLQHGQFGNLEIFLNAVEQFSAQQLLSDGISSIDGEWSARLHLLGICSLARAHSAIKKTNKERHIGEAIQYFFKAASGLGEANKVLQTVFFVPQQHLQGRGATAAWRLQYFEWVMQLFDQYNISEGACQFAHAALEQVDEAVGVSVIENSESDSNSTIKGRLWANVFKFSLDLELYGNAYCAIISNPDEESKDICLRRFIIVLCDRKALQALCGNEFPYGELLSRVEEELVMKAYNSDLNVHASLFKILYALHMQHHNFCRAAGFMYEYAMRIRDQCSPKARAPSLSLLQEELDAFAAAINALLLIESPDDLSSRRVEWFTPIRRLRVSSDKLIDGKTMNGKLLNARKTLDVEQLVKEHALTSARIQLLKANPKSTSVGALVSPSEVMVSLLQHGFYEMAFSLVFLCWKDSSQKKELENVFEVMSRNCCLLQLQTGSKILLKNSEDFQLTTMSVPDSPTNGLHQGALVTTDYRPQSRLQTGTAAKIAWQALQVYLDKYWKLHPNIRVVVADTILTVDMNMELPFWLIKSFNTRKGSRGVNSGSWPEDPAALLRIYINHERYVEATHLVLEFLQNSTRIQPGDVIKRKQACGVWFPYTLVDRLLHQLSSVRGSESVASQSARLHESLQSALSLHFDLIKKDSDDIRVIAEVGEWNGPWKGSP